MEWSFFALRERQKDRESVGRISVRLRRAQQQQQQRPTGHRSLRLPSLETLGMGWSTNNISNNIQQSTNNNGCLTRKYDLRRPVKVKLASIRVVQVVVEGESQEEEGLKVFFALFWSHFH